MNKKRDVQERRRFTRVQVTVEAEVLGGKTLRIRAAATELSMRGFFLRTNRKLRLGTPCAFRLLLGNPAMRPVIHVTGKIIRARRGGFGVELTDIDLNSFDHLSGLVLTRSLDPAKLESEIRKTPLRGS
ncbi:MAG: PilZ domain-containing protein [Candidatus Omnitrophota bacterium]|jgi:hypothetical protein